ncbi:MAG: DUF1080 domain-containing protein, partial [Verrucomicrobia bacterium]|nr:DUF1080 domain-containing protein [Verrucomicrobiota bacterium]
QENPTKGNTFIIWRDGNVDDFELRLQYKIINGNSGIQYRSKDLGNWVIGGYQGDFEAGNTYSGILYEERGRGILAQRGQMTSIETNGDKHRVDVLGSLGASDDIQSHIKNEEWNDYKIIAVENRFVHSINGRVTAIVIDNDANKRVDSGLLALQLHAGPPMTVQFRDIKILKLKPIQVGGTWNMEVFSDQGIGTPVFHFKQKDDVLSGQYDGLFGKSPIKGKVMGDLVEFAVSGEYEGQSVSATYKGKMKPDGLLSGEVTFNDEINLNWAAKRQN